MNQSWLSLFTYTTFFCAAGSFWKPHIVLADRQFDDTDWQFLGKNAKSYPISRLIGLGSAFRVRFDPCLPLPHGQSTPNQVAAPLLISGVEAFEPKPTIFGFGLGF